MKVFFFFSFFCSQFLEKKVGEEEVKSRQKVVHLLAKQTLFFPLYCMMALDEHTWRLNGKKKERKRDQCVLFYNTHQPFKKKKKKKKRKMILGKRGGAHSQCTETPPLTSLLVGHYSPNSGHF